MDKKITLGIILLLAVSMLAFYLVSQPTGLASLPEDYTVKIGYKPSANYVGLFIALENGYFEEEGLKVETVRFDSTNTLMDAFALGQLDATPTGNVIVSYSLENSSPGLFKIYAPAFYTAERHPENLVVRKGSGINTYQDLEGKIIGANKGVFSRTMARKFLEKQGLVDFEIIELGSDLQVPALEAGQIDGLISLEPYPTLAVENGIGEYLEGGSVYSKTVGYSPAFSGGIISTKFLTEHPVEARKFLRAMEKAIDFMSTNYEESKGFLPKYIPIDEEIAQKVTFPEFVYYADLSDEQKQLIQKTADFLFEEQIMEEKVETGGLLLREEYLS